jgi:hypothetical protein
MHPLDQIILVARAGLVFFGLFYGARFIATVVLYCREFCQ